MEHKMTTTSTIRALFASLLLGSVSVAHAITVDFTKSDWSVVNGTNSSSGTGISTSTGVSLSSIGGNLTFNNPDGAEGCGNSGATKNAIIANTGLDCTGDGIGIKDDEITQSSNEALTVSFKRIVNILSIELLDLFADEGSGERAVIQGVASDDFHAVDSGQFLGGGYWKIDFPADGLSLAGISAFTLTGIGDDFSDYSLARIEYEYSVVPVPASVWLFGTALLGFIGLSRRISV